MKCDWEASFELTAGRPSDFFSVLKCVKIPNQRRISWGLGNLEMDSVKTELEDTWERVS